MSTNLTPFTPRGHFHSVQSSGEKEYFPESDGRPMSETDRHRELLIALLHALKAHFRANPKVYVSGNIFVHYRDENGKMQQISPDILVVFGVDKKDRRIYNMDVEGRGPQIVIELTSSSTKVEDFVTKRFVYAYLGVREYFLFDPYSETGPQALQGFRLEQSNYLPMKEFRKKGAVGLHSEVLNLDLCVEGESLRLYDPKTGTRLRTPEESEAERLAAEAKAAAAETEAARLREELAKLRSQKS
jgi:Uma2 family endonuclease